MAQPAEQNFANHARLDPGYHYVLFVLTLIMLGISVSWVIFDQGRASLFALVTSFAMVLTAFKARTYALRVQDRLIRLEERLRLQSVLPEAQRHQILALTESQLIALRFASDQELPALVDAAVTGKLAAKEIKKSIKSWRPDYFRV